MWGGACVGVWVFVCVFVCVRVRVCVCVCVCVCKRQPLISQCKTGNFEALYRLQFQNVPLLQSIIFWDTFDNFSLSKYEHFEF